ncbi:hypothetical protein [uncultured Massilia sp.]|uniref:hypothetical protein n=1 Tax=uncultured Massilia sp. TaxID=169973 RepID=UPI0025DD4AC3|nr:hypothetical protein [uncultured Massilia sp.]
MVRTKTLRHVASGLRDAFVGRNNDQDGYWALGKLYAAADPATPSVVLDLRAGGATPPAPDCLAMARRWADYLAWALGAHGIAVPALARAEVLVEFDAAPDAGFAGPMRYLAGYGKPFRCTVTLGDDAGRLVQSRACGRCWLHDPGRESRRHPADWGRLRPHARRRAAAGGDR